MNTFYSMQTNMEGVGREDVEMGWAQYIVQEGVLMTLSLIQILYFPKKST